MPHLLVALHWHPALARHPATISPVGHVPSHDDRQVRPPLPRQLHAADDAATGAGLVAAGAIDPEVLDAQMVRQMVYAGQGDGNHVLLGVAGIAASQKETQRCHVLDKEGSHAALPG